MPSDANSLGRDLQREILLWQKVKYGHNDIILTTLKFCEEAGEVAGAVIEHDGVHVIDEMGDVMVLLLSIAEMLDVDLADVALTRWREVRVRTNKQDDLPMKAEVQRLTSMVEHWRNEAEYAQERIDKLLAERDDWRLACEIKAKYMIERQLNE